tara:strand:+ start:2778 stop:2891 length:114 start_codon:yes stop_codon:yes gene_type:complete
LGDRRSQPVGALSWWSQWIVFDLLIGASICAAMAFMG